MSLRNKRLGLLLAREIFKVGDEPNRPTTRIQFMSGPSGHETTSGGLCEVALQQFIERTLDSLDRGTALAKEKT